MLNSLASSILSLIILIFIYINAYNRSEKVFTNYKIFIGLVQTDIALIVLDLLGWAFDGLPGPFSRLFLEILNLLNYVIDPLIPMLWILYTNFQVFQDQKRISKLKRFLVTLFIINGSASVASLSTSWFFFLDAQNHYHRGSYYWVHVMFGFMLLIFSLFFIGLNRKRIEKKYYYSLLLFVIPPTLGASIQVFFYGVSLTWTGTMLSLLVIYFNIQDRSLNTDYLTGLYNRRQLDSYIKFKIRNSTPENSFSAILIDLYKFKKINDIFGHNVGDEALQDAAKIIKKCLHRDDFIARFGGDEFFIILDIDRIKLLEQAVLRLKNSTEKFNRDSGKPYKIHFTMGFDRYNPESKMHADDFLKHIDMLMYENKI